MKNTIAFLLLVNLFSMHLFGQKNTIFKFNQKHSLHCFVQLRSAIDQTKFENTQGEISFDSRTNVVQTYSFGLNYQLTDEFSLSTKFSKSYSNSLTFENIRKEVNFPTPWYGLGGRLNDVSYGLNWGVSYQKNIKNKFWLNGTLGFGRNNNTTIYSRQYNADYSGSDEEYSLIEMNSVYASNKLFLEIGISKYFSQSRNLNLSIVYEHFLNPKFEGSYEFKTTNDWSKGVILNRGNNLGLSLTYRMGRQERFLKYKAKKAKIVQLSKDSVNLDYWKAKDIVDKGDRKVWDPKSILIHANTGMFFTRNKFFIEDGETNRNVFKSNYTLTMAHSISAEIGIKNNFYLEAGYGYDKYSFKPKLDKEEKGIILADSYNNNYIDKYYFSTSKLNLGMGWRLFSKRTNKPLLNLQAGASLSFVNKPNADYVSGFSYYEYPVPSFYYIGYLERTLFPSVYLGVGRDFELNKNLFFTMNFRFNQGLIEIYKTEIRFDYDDPESNEVVPLRFYTINGTSMSFSIGLKYKFLPKKYRK